jgi:DNA-binding GntR family transcriptional regulator
VLVSAKNDQGGAPLERIGAAWTAITELEVDTVLDKLDDNAKRRTSLATQIYTELRQRLSRGEIKIGEKLVDVAVADSMGVSRMPVREALSRLVHEGYLVGTSRGFELQGISLEDAAEIFEMRRLLEPRAAGSATPQLSPETLNKLSQALNRARATVALEDPEQFTEAHREFRNIWLAYVPNRRLASAIERFIEQTDHIRRLTLVQQAARHVALGLVSALFEAFERRDGMQAHDCVARQVDAGWELYRKLAASESNEQSPR